MNYKNLGLIVISLILFVYAGFIAILPKVMASTFNQETFSANLRKAVGLNAKMKTIDIKISPNFDTTVYVTGLEIEFPDKQPVASANYAELRTTPGFLFGNKIIIKKFIANQVKYDDLILPNGVNKIAYVPESFKPKYIGKNGLTIVSGPVEIKEINTSHTTTKPYSYSEKKIPDIIMTKGETKEYLQSLNFKNVKIK